MTAIQGAAATQRSDRERRSLLALGWLTSLLAALHLIDHALRGERVHDHGFDPSWDHSGWPFKDDVTPYTYSLIAVVIILGFGLWGTSRGKLWAGYWLGAAIVLGAIVTIVHLLPTPQQESPTIIYNSWSGLSVVGAAAVAVMLAIVAALVLMAVNAIRVGRSTKRWW